MDIRVDLDSFGFGLLKKPAAGSFLLPKILEPEVPEGCVKMLVLACEIAGEFCDSVGWLDEKSPPKDLLPAFPKKLDPPDEVDGAAVLAELGPNE